MSTHNIDGIADHLIQEGWFNGEGVHAIVDGQFGSTGKGVAASLLAHAIGKTRYKRSFWAVTNAGPNSGHTSVYKGRKVVTQQLPISAVQSEWMNNGHRSYLNAGSIIDLHQLRKEIKEYSRGAQVVVHPNAAIISLEDAKAETEGELKRIAGTGKGVGAALSRKVMRGENVAKYYAEEIARMGAVVHNPEFMDSECIIMEVAQGFSLGINQRFYPYSTSRECTVGQAMSDAGLHHYHHRKTLMCVRTFPIRVGNTADGNSGSWYTDQHEITWADIGQPEELTTVTKRVRRLATWSRIQFRDAVRANRPDTIFLNFANYLNTDDLGSLIRDIKSDYKTIMGHALNSLIVGWGPETEQCTLWI